MATSISILKTWFTTGKKPTQAQFWAWLDAFWHKDEQIPTSSISGLENALNGKASADQLNSHINDDDAHPTLERKSEKGQAGGYAPLDEFGILISSYLKLVNDLVTGGTDAVLSAEQGKNLQNQIDGINTLLSSDDVNLDTVQELVDAIKEVETSLTTILVNDLTTGGVTKALTAEMGKLLNQNKAEKGGYEGTLQGLKDDIVSQTDNLALTIQATNGRIDNLDDELDMYQMINNQIYVSGSGLVQDSWHGKLVTFTASVTITVPASGLRTGFNFEGIVDPTVTVNTAITAPKAWHGGYIGAPIGENSIFTFIQRSNNSDKVSIYGL